VATSLSQSSLFADMKKNSKRRAIANYVQLRTRPLLCGFRSSITQKKLNRRNFLSPAYRPVTDKKSAYSCVPIRVLLRTVGIQYATIRDLGVKAPFEYIENFYSAFKIYKGSLKF